jgi:hypothetical protein
MAHAPGSPPERLPIDPGRKTRGQSKVNLTLREMVEHALRIKGGVQYLAKLPDHLFVQLCAKVMPLELKAEFDNVEIVVHRLQVNPQPVPGVIASPVQGHVLKLVNGTNPDLFEADDGAAPG